MAKKVDRDFFDRKRARPGFKRLLGTDIKERSRCANCGEKGHWADSCTSPYRAKSDRLAAEKDKPRSSGTGFSATTFLFENDGRDGSLINFAGQAGFTSEDCRLTSYWE
eukprot:890296-Pyramimonas_sp.AAC.1